MIQRITSITLLPRPTPIFDESGFTLTIDNEAAGEFLVVKSQSDRSGDEAQNSITIDPHEWAALRKAINRMMREIAKHEVKQ